MFPSREIATLALAMTRGGGGYVLHLRQFTSFPFQEMFRLRFTPLNMTCGDGVSHLFVIQSDSVGIQPSGAFRSARLPRRNIRCSLAMTRKNRNIPLANRVGCKIANLRNRLPSSLHYMRARTCTYTHTCDSFIHEL